MELEDVNGSPPSSPSPLLLLTLFLFSLPLLYTLTNATTTQSPFIIYPLYLAFSQLITLINRDQHPLNLPKSLSFSLKPHLHYLESPIHWPQTICRSKRESICKSGMPKAPNDTPLIWRRRMKNRSEGSAEKNSTFFCPARCDAQDLWVPRWPGVSLLIQFLFADLMMPFGVHRSRRIHIYILVRQILIMIITSLLISTYFSLSFSNPPNSTKNLSGEFLNPYSHMYVRLQVSTFSYLLFSPMANFKPDDPLLFRESVAIQRDSVIISPSVIWDLSDPRPPLRGEIQGKSTVSKKRTSGVNKFGISTHSLGYSIHNLVSIKFVSLSVICLIIQALQIIFRTKLLKGFYGNKDIFGCSGVFMTIHCVLVVLFYEEYRWLFSTKYGDAWYDDYTSVQYGFKLTKLYAVGSIILVLLLRSIGWLVCCSMSKHMNGMSLEFLRTSMKVLPVLVSVHRINWTFLNLIFVLFCGLIIPMLEIPSSGANKLA